MALGPAWLILAESAVAQEARRIYRIGFVVQFSRGAPQLLPLLEELSQAGFSEGKNLSLDPQGFGLAVERIAATAVAVAAAAPDAIVCGGELATRAAQQATSTIPILAVSDDLLAEKLVASFAHPGGNTTGISILAPELNGKRQELLLEMVPGVRRLAALVDPQSAALRQVRALEDAAHGRSIELSVHRAGTAPEIIPAVEEARQTGAQALNVLASPLFNANRAVLIAGTAAAGLPAIYFWPEIAEDGGLAAYGPRLSGVFRQLGRQLVKVLRGAKPAEVATEQPTKFELVINLKTATALGLVISPALLARADEVIE
jgi:putative ABC transport system substrate-binding protein